MTAIAIDPETSPTRQVQLVEQAIGANMDASLSWVFDLAALVRDNQLDRAVTRRACSNLAWMARYLGHRLPTDDDWAHCAESDDPQETRRILAYVHGFRLRFDLKFGELARRTTQWIEDVPDDALIYALATFAAMGSRASTVEQMRQYVESRPDYDSVCRWVCLHGLWFATHLPDQARRIIALSDDLIERGEDAANLYYWRASALRRQGQLTAALASVDKAIDLLPPGMNTTHQEFAGERELIAATESLNRHSQALKDQLTAQLHDQPVVQAIETPTTELAAQLRDELAAQLRDQLAAQPSDQIAAQLSDTVYRQMQLQLTEMHRQLHQRLDELAAGLDQQTQTTRRTVSDSLRSIATTVSFVLALAVALIGANTLILKIDNSPDRLTTAAVIVAGALVLFVGLRWVIRLGIRRAGRPKRRSTGPAAKS